MAKNKVTSNGEKNQEAKGKQEAPVIIDDAFNQIEDTAKMLKFLIETSRIDAAHEGGEFVITAEKMLCREVNNLNETMKDLAEHYQGLDYRQVVPSV